MSTATQAGARRVTIDPYAGFWPFETQAAFLRYRPPNPLKAYCALLSSGYGSGGKSTVACRFSIRNTLPLPHSRHVVSRFHYDDLEQTTMVTYFEALDRIGLNDGSKAGPRHYIFRKSPRPEISWWNGAWTGFRNLDDPSGSKYGSMECNTWVIDEGFEVPTEVMETIYPSRLRWHLPGCAMREEMMRRLALGMDVDELECECLKALIICSNPGPNEFLERIVEGRGGAQTAHFPVPPGENKALGKAYYEDLRDNMARYGPHHLARFYEGKWSAFAGQRFAMLDRDIHFLPADLDPSMAEFDIIEGHDFGFRVAHGTVWIAVHKSREFPPIVVDDYEEAEKEIPVIATDIKSMRHRRRFGGLDLVAVGDPAGSQTRGNLGISDIMLFAQHGLEIAPMTMARDPGPRADLIALMLSRQVVTKLGPMRGLMFNPRAHRTFERLLKYRYAEKPRNSHADAPEKFVKKDDHLVDALGYGVSAISDPLETEGRVDHSQWAIEMRARARPTIEELDAGLR